MIIMACGFITCIEIVNLWVGILQITMVKYKYYWILRIFVTLNLQVIYNTFMQSSFIPLHCLNLFYIKHTRQEMNSYLM